jgi:hypothetical protein
VAKLEKMNMRRSFILLCKDAQSNPSVTAAAKETIAIQGYLLDAKDAAYVEEAERTALDKHGEELLARHPDHALADKLTDSLATSMKVGFDAAGRWQASLDRLQKLMDATPSPALKARIESLKSQREKFVSNIEMARKQISDEQAQAYFAAQLGDARTAVKILSKPQYAESQQYEMILKQARAKLAQADAGR